MKIIYKVTLLVIIIQFWQVNSQAQTWEYAVAFGNTVADETSVLEVDRNGNQYIAGRITTNNVVLNNGVVASTNYNSSPGALLFAKFNINGQAQFAKIANVTGTHLHVADIAEDIHPNSLLVAVELDGHMFYDNTFISSADGRIVILQIAMDNGNLSNYYQYGTPGITVHQVIKNPVADGFIASGNASSDGTVHGVDVSANDYYVAGVHQGVPWTRVFYGDHERITSIAADTDGIYVAGTFDSYLYAQSMELPFPISVTSGFNSIFIVKYVDHMYPQVEDFILGENGFGPGEVSHVFISASNSLRIVANIVGQKTFTLKNGGTVDFNFQTPGVGMINLDGSWNLQATSTITSDDIVTVDDIDSKLGGTLVGTMRGMVDFNGTLIDAGQTEHQHFLANYYPSYDYLNFVKPILVNRQASWDLYTDQDDQGNFYVGGNFEAGMYSFDNLAVGTFPDTDILLAKLNNSEIYKSEASHKSVSPNPVSTEITLNGFEDSDVEVRILNSNGREKLSVRLGVSEAKKIDVSSLRKGFYIVKVTEGRAEHSFRIAKQ